MIINIKPPIIAEETEKVILWARKKKQSHMSTSTIFKLLLSDKLESRWKKDKELVEVRKLFHRYSSSKDSVLFAIQINAYMFRNDIKEGQVVTNGEFVGFAYNIDFHIRTFDLFDSVEKREYSYINTFNIEDFRALQHSN